MIATIIALLVCVISLKKKERTTTKQTNLAVLLRENHPKR